MARAVVPGLRAVVGRPPRAVVPALRAVVPALALRAVVASALPPVVP